jgi:hypothetical protein
MNTPSTRTIWLATAALFGLAALVSLVSGSVFLAIVLVLITIGAVVASRRAPADDGGRIAKGGDDADSEDDTQDDRDDEDHAGDEPRKDDKRLWSDDREDDGEDPPEPGRRHEDDA